MAETLDFAIFLTNKSGKVAKYSYKSPSVNEWDIEDGFIIDSDSIHVRLWVNTVPTNDLGIRFYISFPGASLFLIRYLDIIDPGILVDEDVSIADATGSSSITLRLLDSKGNYTFAQPPEIPVDLTVETAYPIGDTFITGQGSDGELTESSSGWPERVSFAVNASDYSEEFTIVEGGGSHYELQCR